MDENLKKRICPCCKQEVMIEVGFKKDNFKRLFRKPTLDDWITLFIIAMVILAAYAYSLDTKTCRQTLNDLPATCAKLSASYMQNGSFEPYKTDWSNMTIILDKGSESDG